MEQVNRSVLMMVVMLMAAVLIWSPPARARGTGEPSVQVPETRYNFAPVPEGTVVSHDFTVKNKGTAPLEITSVKSG